MAVYTIDPFDAQMPFPLDLRYRKADLNGRNSIPANARYPGMLCWTNNERVVWVLDAGNGGDLTDNNNWKQLYPTGGGGGGVQNVTWSANAPSTQGDDGDIWFRDNAGTGNIDLYFKVAGSWGLLGSWSKSGPSPTSLLTISADTELDWQTDIAPDETGSPSGQTYAQRFGNTPQIQVWIETSTGKYSLETVPITMELSGSNIGTVNVDTSDMPARIIIK